MKSNGYASLKSGLSKIRKVRVLRRQTGWPLLLTPGYTNQALKIAQEAARRVNVLFLVVDVAQTKAGA